VLVRIVYFRDDMLRSIVLASLALTACTAGQVVDDATSAPVPYAFVELFNTDAHQSYDVKTDSSGRFSFDPSLTHSQDNQIKAQLSAGHYTVRVGTSVAPITACRWAWGNVNWDHVSADGKTFNLTYDSTCNGSDGNPEPCELYQIRMSAKHSDDPSATLPTSDDHAGHRVITVYKPSVGGDFAIPDCESLLPGEPLPCFSPGEKCSDGHICAGDFTCSL
jgi:hypothetical protein